MTVSAVRAALGACLIPLAWQCWAAEYRVTFEALWSQSTHPEAYPSSAHFSPLIGVTHNPLGVFWAEGNPASAGIQNMAELGSTSTLRSEMESEIDTGNAFVILSGPGTFFSPGEVSLIFETPESHPLVTLVTMVAPSPDWFVGVSALDLMEGGTWNERIEVELFALDAGTDSGQSFTASNAVTSPQGLIGPIVDGPLSNPVLPVLGRFVFERLDTPQPLPLGCVLQGGGAGAKGVFIPSLAEVLLLFMLTLGLLVRGGGEPRRN